MTQGITHSPVSATSTGEEQCVTYVGTQRRIYSHVGQNGYDDYSATVDYPVATVVTVLLVCVCDHHVI